MYNIAKKEKSENITLIWESIFLSYFQSILSYFHNNEGKGLSREGSLQNCYSKKGRVLFRMLVACKNTEVSLQYRRHYENITSMITPLVYFLDLGVPLVLDYRRDWWGSNI